MNKKGLTLVELLAVIVIVTLVFLITIPFAEKAITKTRMQSYKTSANNYIRDIEKQIASDFAKGKDKVLKNGRYTIDDGGLYFKDDDHVYELDVKGETPSGGSICLDDDGKIVRYSLKFKKYVVTKLDSDKEPTVKKSNQIDSFVCGDDAGFATALSINVAPDDEDPPGIKWAKVKEVELQDLQNTGYQIEYKIDRNGKWQTYNGKFTVTKNCSIYARLTDGVVKLQSTSRFIGHLSVPVKVTFDPMGGVMDDEDVPESVWTGYEFGHMPVPFKYAYTFLGWFTDPVAGEEIKYNTVINSDEPITLYAHWSAASTSESSALAKSVVYSIDDYKSVTIKAARSTGHCSSSTDTYCYGGEVSQTISATAKAYVYLCTGDTTSTCTLLYSIENKKNETYTHEFTEADRNSYSGFYVTYSYSVGSCTVGENMCRSVSSKPSASASATGIRYLYGDYSNVETTATAISGNKRYSMTEYDGAKIYAYSKTGSCGFSEDSGGCVYHTGSWPKHVSISASASASLYLCNGDTCKLVSTVIAKPASTYFFSTKERATYNEFYVKLSTSKGGCSTGACHAVETAAEATAQAWGLKIKE